MAEILGERDFRSILQQGVQESIYTSLVGEQWLLVVVFEKQTHIGLVKVLARKASEELERTLERVRVGRHGRRKSRSSMCSFVARSRTRLTGSSRTKRASVQQLPRRLYFQGTS